MKTMTSENGFTLIEMLIVLVVCILIIGSGILPNPFKAFIDLFNKPKHQMAQTVKNHKRLPIKENTRENTLQSHQPTQAEEPAEPENSQQEEIIFSPENSFPDEIVNAVNQMDGNEMKENPDEENSLSGAEDSVEEAEPPAKTTNPEKELYQTYLSIWDEMNDVPEKIETNDTSSL